MTFDMQSLFPDFEALTPDGRWNALQDWLKQNPEYGERIEEWSRQTVDQVYVSIRDLLAKKYRVSTMMIMLFINAETEAKIKSTISTLQALYRERAGETEKEIKNVNNVSGRTSGIRKRSKRTSARSR